MCLLLSLWLLSGFPMSMGEAAKRVVFEGFNVSNLKEVSHEMLLLRLPRVSSCVSGFSLASQCLCGKLQIKCRPLFGGAPGGVKFK